MTHDIRIRRLSGRDWNAVLALEAGAYADSGLSEDGEALRSRALASPGTCFVLDAGPRTAGYVLALPYPLFRYPDLSRGEDTTFDSRNLHLHDIVIAPELRGRGLGRLLLRHLTATAGARGYERISLVSVGGSAPFWAAHGYRPHDEVALPASYGTGARYMSAPVRASRPVLTGR
ncbi:GNAT family N-acetyltransferase [Streptomyces sp. NPDC006368]|uniref:GNAT family N-acetyltransferase n=1 Tax=Streptomyces sp. NPDC006368 TaxID=3156760 RepID=UPI0033B6272B